MKQLKFSVTGFLLDLALVLTGMSMSIARYVTHDFSPGYFTDEDRKKVLDNYNKFFKIGQ